MTHISGILGRDNQGQYIVLSSDSQSTAVDEPSKYLSSKYIIRNCGKVLMLGTGDISESNLIVSPYIKTINRPTLSIDRESQNVFGLIYSSDNDTNLNLRYLKSNNHTHFNTKLKGKRISRKHFSYEIKKEIESDYYVREFKRAPIILAGSGSSITIPTLRDEMKTYQKRAETDLIDALALSYELQTLASMNLYCDNNFNFAIKRLKEKPLIFFHPETVNNVGAGEKKIYFYEIFMGITNSRNLVERILCFNDLSYTNQLTAEIMNIYRNFYTIFTKSLSELSRLTLFDIFLNRDDIEIIGFDEENKRELNLEERIFDARTKIQESIDAYSKGDFGEFVEFVNIQMQQEIIKNSKALNSLLI